MKNFHMNEKISKTPPSVTNGWIPKMKQNPGTLEKDKLPLKIAMFSIYNMLVFFKGLYIFERQTCWEFGRPVSLHAKYPFFGGDQAWCKTYGNFGGFPNKIVCCGCILYSFLNIFYIHVGTLQERLESSQPGP